MQKHNRTFVMYMPSTKIQLSVHLVFDELSEVGKTTKNFMLEFTEPANVEYLIKVSRKHAVHGWTYNLRHN